MFTRIAFKRACIGFIVICLAISYCKAQDFEPMFQMINKRNLDSARFLINNALKSHPNEPEVNYALGKVDMMSGDIFNAVKCYEKVLNMPNIKPHTKGWIYHDLAICYFSLGNKINAERLINSCLELNATRNVVNSAKYLAKILGFDSLYKSWKTVETAHFIFHFQNPTINIEKITQEKEQAFYQVNEFFKASLPKKIDYFVWSDDATGSNMLKRDLAFTQPSLAITHTSPFHTLGHEITHTISYFTAPFAKPHKLISEGVCVNFDFSKRNNISLLKKKGNAISIENIWKNNILVNDAIIYSLGGELVKRLINEFGREKFLLLLSNQSYNNAIKIYGNDLKKIFQVIENEVNQ